MLSLFADLLAAAEAADPAGGAASADPLLPVAALAFATSTEGAQALTGGAAPTALWRACAVLCERLRRLEESAAELHRRWELVVPPEEPEEPPPPPEPSAWCGIDTEAICFIFTYRGPNGKCSCPAADARRVRRRRTACELAAAIAETRGGAEALSSAGWDRYDRSNSSPPLNIYLIERRDRLSPAGLMRRHLLAPLRRLCESGQADNVLLLGSGASEWCVARASEWCVAHPLLRDFIFHMPEALTDDLKFPLQGIDHRRLF